VKALEFSNRPKLGFGPQFLVIGLMIALVFAMAIGPTRQLLEQRERISGMESELHSIQRSNSELEDRIARLNDPDYLEQQARAQSGLVRPGERAFVVMPPSKVPGIKHREHLPEKPPPPDPSLIEGFLDFVGLR
jgi:cell division protein FtsB